MFRVLLVLALLGMLSIAKSLAAPLSGVHHRPAHAQRGGLSGLWKSAFGSGHWAKPIAGEHRPITSTYHFHSREQHGHKHSITDLFGRGSRPGRSIRPAQLRRAQRSTSRGVASLWK